MKKRRLFWTVGLVAVLLALPFVIWGGYAAIGLIRGELFYRGLPASYWRGRVRSRDDEAVPPAVSVTVWQWRRRAERFFGMGSSVIFRCEPEAIPVLTVLLADEDPAVHQGAAIGLGLCGPNAKALIPALVRMTRDSDTRAAQGARWALRRIEPASEPPARVGDIMVIGNAATPQTFILPLLGLRPGQPFTAGDLAAAERRLPGLWPWIGRATIEVPEDNGSATRDLFVTVEERLGGRMFAAVLDTFPLLWEIVRPAWGDRSEEPRQLPLGQGFSPPTPVLQ
jgi:hypothetical protein